MLTSKQYKILLFIKNYLQQHNISPSFYEIQKALGLKSKSSVHNLILSLEERGFIRRLANKARSLAVLKLPSDDSAMNTNLIKHNDDVIFLPLCGKIAAGSPIEAISGHFGNICIPSHMLKNGKYYLLTVEGDSMIDAGIIHHDTIIIERSDTANNGAIVVALLIDDNEVTLKRLWYKNSLIVLEPANKNYDIKVLDANKVQIQGYLVGLLRHYLT